MSITAVSEFKRWRRECWRKENEVAIWELMGLLHRGFEFIDEDKDRYLVDCPVEYQTCSMDPPCSAEGIENNWDLHLSHIEIHCWERTCSHCYVIDKDAEL